MSSTIIRAQWVVTPDNAGIPSFGEWAQGDHVTDKNGSIWVCLVGGNWSSAVWQQLGLYQNRTTYSANIEYTTPGLAAGTAVLYTPIPHEFLTDVYFDLDQAWNATAKLDIGLFKYTGGPKAGLFTTYGSSGVIDLTSGDVGADTTGLHQSYLPSMSNAWSWMSAALGPPEFVTADPLCVTVTQSGVPSTTPSTSTSGIIKVTWEISAAPVLVNVE